MPTFALTSDSSSNCYRSEDADVMPPCHIFSESSTPIFSESSGNLVPLTSLPDGQRKQPMFLRTFSQPRHFSSDRPLSHSLFSFHDQLPRYNVHASLVFLRSIARPASSHTPFFSSSHSCCAAHLLQWIILACFRSMTPPMSTVACSSNIKV